MIARLEVTDPLAHFADNAGALVADDDGAARDSIAITQASEAREPTEQQRAEGICRWQVERMVGISQRLGREVATPAEAREMLALKGGDRVEF